MKASGSGWCFLPLLIVLCPLHAAAQVPDPGQRVRLKSAMLAGDPLVADVLRIDPDSVVLARGGEYWAFPRSTVTELEVVSGAHRHTLRGALVGSVGLGLILGQDMLRKPGQCEGSGNYGQLCALFLVGAMVGGGAVGAMVGALIRHDEWISVSLGASGPGAIEEPYLARPHRLTISVAPALR